MKGQYSQIFRSDSHFRKLSTGFIFGLCLICIIFFGVGFGQEVYNNARFFSVLENKSQQKAILATQSAKKDYDNLFFYDSTRGNSYLALQEHIQDISSLIFRFHYDHEQKSMVNQSTDEFPSVLEYLEFTDYRPKLAGLFSVDEIHLDIDTVSPLIQNTLAGMNARTVILEAHTDLSLRTQDRIQSLINTLKNQNYTILLKTSLFQLSDNNSSLKNLDSVIVDPFDYSDKDLERNLFSLDIKRQLQAVLSQYSSIHIATPAFSEAVTLWEGKRVWKSRMNSDDIQKLAQSKEIIPKFEPSINAMQFEYIDEQGALIQVQLADHVSFFNFFQDFRLNDGFKGWSFTQPGEEIDSIWNYTTTRDWPSLALQEQRVVWNIRNIIEGNGAFFSIKKNETVGKVELVTDANGKITSAKYTNSPQRAVITKSGAKDLHIALTFDDGPDPNTTPLVLDWLKRYNLKAVFFVVGKQVTLYPDIAKRIVNEGHIIANHTYSHPNMVHYSKEEIMNEVKTTQDLIKITTGVEACYFRTPYTAFQNYQTRSSIKNLEIASKLGLTVQELDLNTKDYLSNSSSEIVKEVEQALREKQATQILFHDTLAADTLLPAMDQVRILAAEHNHTIVRSDGLLNNVQEYSQSTAEITTPILGFSRLTTAQKILLGFSTIFALYTALRFIFGVSAYIRDIQQSKQRKSKIYSPPVSILVPCYNEEKVIAKTLDSLIKSKYNHFEIIVLNDGSYDATAMIVRQYTSRHRFIRLLSLQNGGKAKALNAGVTHAKYDIVICVDADTQIDPYAITELVQPFRDRTICATAGYVMVGNNNKILTKLQEIEYLISQTFDKITQHVLGAITVVPGALEAFRKSALKRVGKYQSDTLAEDTDLTFRIHQQGGKIVFAHKAYARTEVPENLTQLSKQRLRWTYGNLQIVWKHRNLLRSSNNLALKYLFLPLLIFGMLFAPFNLILTIVATGYLAAYLIQQFGGVVFLHSIGLGPVDPVIVIYFLSNIALFGIMVIFAKWVKQKRLSLTSLLLIPLNMLIYTSYLNYIGIIALLKAGMGLEARWGHLKRKGSVEVKTVSAAH